MECEVWSLEFGASSIKWSVKCGVGSKERMECKVWSGLCEAGCGV